MAETPSVKLEAGKPKLWLRDQDQLKLLGDTQLHTKRAFHLLRNLPGMTEFTDEQITEMIEYYRAEEGMKEEPEKENDMSKLVPFITPAMADVLDTSTPVLLTVQPPKGEKRTFVDMCCVIDVSGSMGSEATIQSATGATESHGLSLLDIAKHGLRTVVETLSEGDRLSLVLFNHSSQLVFGLTDMDEAGRKMACEKLNELRPGGGTNIWHGLQEGLNALKEGAGTGRIGHIMLLTDGQTMQRESVMDNLKDYKEKNESLPGTVSTFGFGYSIDSDLLVQIADFGDGTYSFIPDAGFVGTVFVKTLSNLLVTIGRAMTVSLEVENGELTAVLGQYRMSTTGGIHQISMGTLQYEQSRSFVFAVKATGAAPPNVSASVTFDDGKSKQSIDFVELDLAGDSASKAVESELLRCRYIDTVSDCLRTMKGGRGDLSDRLEGAQKSMAALGDDIQSSSAADEEKIQALLQDVKGQSAEAVSKREWFEKWGVHYLPSIMFAHRAQQSNNFKDPSVQFYGGDVFNKMVDTADDIFNCLPAPEPTARRPMSSYSNSSVSAPPPAPVSMAAYNDRYGVCIDASSLTQLAATGRLTPVGELRQGDVVTAPDGATARVVCVVRTPCSAGKASLVELPGGARVTPFHPISWQGQWRFPADIAAVQERECHAVCSVILHGAPALLVGFVPSHGQDDSIQGSPTVACVALGHGLEEGAAKHPYFGTHRVLEDLACAPGYKNGMVEIQSGNVIRDIDTGLVCGFSFPQ